jgi:hypothetical protein
MGLWGLFYELSSQNKPHAYQVTTQLLKEPFCFAVSGLNKQTEFTAKHPHKHSPPCKSPKSLEDLRASCDQVRENAHLLGLGIDCACSVCEKTGAYTEISM